MNFINLKPSKMEIKVLGTGCAKCKTLENHTKKAVQQLAIKADVIKVEDIAEIMKFGVMTTPALVVDGKVVVKGKVPSVSYIKDLLTK
jgi:small redox-active disulfide protein 2